LINCGVKFIYKFLILMFHICGCRYSSSSSSKNTVQATVGYSTRRIYMVV